MDLDISDCKKCGAIIYNSAGNILLVKQKESRKWGFPKGSMKVGESKIETSIRETKEETGIDISVYGKVIKTIMINGCFFLVVCLDDIDEINEYKINIIDTKEIVKAKFFRTIDIRTLDSNSLLKKYYKLMRSISM